MKNSPYLDKPFIPLAVASRYARDSFLSRGVVSATLPAQGADNNTAYSGGGSRLWTWWRFRRHADHAAGRRRRQAETGLTAPHPQRHRRILDTV
jgi:hypothetical protein